MFNLKQTISRKSNLRGVSLIAILLGMVITALIASAKLRNDLLESRRAAGLSEASVLLAVQKAANSLFDEASPNFRAGVSFSKNANTVTLAVVNTVPTYSVTVAQLTAMGYLPTGWTQANSTLNEQPYRIRVTRLPVGCTGSACALEGLVWIDGAIRADNQVGTTDGPAIGQMMVRIGSDSATSLSGSAATLTGFANGWTTANPVSTQPAGVFAVRFAGVSSIDYLRTGETRDPNFAGTVTIAGPASLGGSLTVTGSTTLNGTNTFGGASTFNAGVTINSNATVTGNLSANSLTLGAAGCINMNGTTGRAGFGCANQSDTPAGYTGVRTPDMVAQNRVLVSNVPAAFTGSNGRFAIMTSDDGFGAAEMRTSGRVTGDRLVPTGIYTETTACADEGALGRRTGGGAVLCSSSVWTRLVATATVGGACTSGTSGTTSAGIALLCINGAFVPMANMFPIATVGANCTDEGVVGYSVSAAGVPTGGFICRRNNAALGVSARWYRLQDTTSNLAFVQSFEVTDQTIVNHPLCPVAGGQTVNPILQFRPGVLTTADGGISMFAGNGASSWTVNLKNGAGGPLTSSSGNARVIVDTYCFYF